MSSNFVFESTNNYFGLSMQRLSSINIADLYCHYHVDLYTVYVSFRHVIKLVENIYDYKVCFTWSYHQVGNKLLWL
jgi:hypothetical protein